MFIKRTVFLLLALLLTVAPAVWLSGACLPLEEPVDIHAQTLPAFERRGFTVVEWGGAEVQ